MPEKGFLYKLFKRKNKHDSPANIKNIYKSHGRYLFQKDLGEGGSSRVKSIFDTALNRFAASKELRKKHLSNKVLTALFINEARLISYLDHPGIVSIYDTFLSENGTPCYSMRLIEGRTLGSLVEENIKKPVKILPVARCIEIFLKICETMAYAHHKGVIHLDLKPDNIMLGRYGEVLIVDWGTARLYNTDKYQEYIGQRVDKLELPAVNNETQDMIMGTLEYMSPEHFSSRREGLTPAADVFCAGIMLYEILTGIQPFEADSFEEAQDKVLHHDPVPAHKVTPGVPRMLSQICEKMMKKELKDRFGNFNEVLKIMRIFMDSGQTFSGKRYKAGEYIFKEGDPGTFAFIIESGSVEISKISSKGRKRLAVLGKNQIAGELAIFSHCGRTAAARALETTTIRILNREDVEKELDKLSPWVSRMVTGLSSRFIGLNQELLDNSV